MDGFRLRSPSFFSHRFIYHPFRIDLISFFQSSIKLSLQFLPQRNSNNFVEKFERNVSLPHLTFDVWEFEEGSFRLGWHRCSAPTLRRTVPPGGDLLPVTIPFPAKKNTRGGGPSIVAEGVINEKGISRQPPRVGIAQAAQACTPRTSSFPPKISTFSTCPLRLK